MKGKKKAERNEERLRRESIKPESCKHKVTGELVFVIRCHGSVDYPCSVVSPSHLQNINKRRMQMCKRVRNYHVAYPSGWGGREIQRLFKPTNISNWFGSNIDL